MRTGQKKTNSKKQGEREDESKHAVELEGELHFEVEHVVLMMTELEWLFGEAKLVLGKM